MKLISFVYSHCVVFVSIRFQLGRRRINFLVSFQQNCSIWTRAEVAVGSIIIDNDNKNDLHGHLCILSYKI